VTLQPVPSAGAPGSAGRPVVQDKGITIADACAMRSATWGPTRWVVASSAVGGALLAKLAQTLTRSGARARYSRLDRAGGHVAGGRRRAHQDGPPHPGSSLNRCTTSSTSPPSALHPHDIQRLNGLLPYGCGDKGNTVARREHKPETIAIGDPVVASAGRRCGGGGTVCFDGKSRGLRGQRTVTGRHFDERAASRRRCAADRRGGDSAAASADNTARTSTSTSARDAGRRHLGAGSGKSSMIRGSVRGGTCACRSIRAHPTARAGRKPATYTGLLDPIVIRRRQANGVKPARSVPTPRARLSQCTAPAVIYTDLEMMAGRRHHLRVARESEFEASVLDHPSAAGT